MVGGQVDREAGEVLGGRVPEPAFWSGSEDPDRAVGAVQVPEQQRGSAPPAEEQGPASAPGPLKGPLQMQAPALEQPVEEALWLEVGLPQALELPWLLHGHLAPLKVQHRDPETGPEL